MVSGSVVSDEDNVPEVVHSNGGENNVRIVQLVVVAHPGSNESPEGLHSCVSTKSSNFLWLSPYNRQSLCKASCDLPRTGLFQRFLGASLAVKGVKFFS